MNVGLSAYNMSAADLVDLAAASDECGFSDLWLGEHIVLPCDYASEHPTTGESAHQHHRGPIIDPHTKLVDPLVAMAAMAAVTTRLRLATGIYLLGARHPLVSARMTATLHDVSHGRFLLGVGSGWLREEFAALGIPFEERVGRYEEAIDVLRAAWAGGPFRHDGHHFRFDSVQVAAEPLAIPLILGGNTEPALARAVARADGWFASGTPSFDDACHLRDRVRELRRAAGLTGAFPLWFRMPGSDPGELDRYRAEGFENVLVWADQLWPAIGNLAEKRAALAAGAARLGVVSSVPVAL